jgi:hypothetical protein
MEVDMCAMLLPGAAPFPRDFTVSPRHSGTCRSRICSNSLLPPIIGADDAIIGKVSSLLDAGLVQGVIDDAVELLRAGRAGDGARRESLQREIDAIATEQATFADAIARGSSGGRCYSHGPVEGGSSPTGTAKIRISRRCGRARRVSGFEVSSYTASGSAEERNRGAVTAVFASVRVLRLSAIV